MEAMASSDTLQGGAEPQHHRRSHDCGDDLGRHAVVAHSSTLASFSLSRGSRPLFLVADGAIELASIGLSAQSQHKGDT